MQFNIDRGRSYAIPWGSALGEHTYVQEKWGVGIYEAVALLPFLNTVLTGENWYTRPVVRELAERFGVDIEGLA